MATPWYSLPSFDVIKATAESVAYEHMLDRNRKVLIAHAVLGCLALAFFAPVGAVFIRLKLPINLLRLHGFWQSGVWALYAVAFGLGLWLKSAIGQVHLNKKWTDPHAIISFILMGLLTVQPVLGYVHHIIFKKRLQAIQAGAANAKAPGRTPVIHTHLWVGRILIPLGIVNGAFGIRATWSKHNPLQSAHTSKIAMIVYCNIAGVIFLLYLAVCIQHEYRRTMEVVKTEEGEAAAVEVAGMPNSRRQSLETGKEILRITEAQQNAHMGDDEIPLTAVSEKRDEEEREVSAESLPAKI